MTGAIDTHVHYVPDVYLDILEEEAAGNEAFAAQHARFLWMLRENTRPLRHLSVLRTEMAAAGVDVSVMSLPPPGATFGDRSRQREVARRANDALLADATGHDGHINVLASLPTDPDDALAEAQRVSEHPLCRGLAMLTVTSGVLIDDPRLEAVYRHAARSGLLVQAHPAQEQLPTSWTDFLLASSLAPLVTSTLGAARLVLSGMLDRVPDLDVVIPHLGGTLPFLLQRMVDFGPGDAEHTMDHYFSHRLYMDTCSLHPPALRCALEVSSPDRLMLGSDFPYRGAVRRATECIEQHIHDPADRDAILFRTARRWFGPRTGTSNGATS
ncbi:MAG: amidohydrolase family protein [Acidimicrobiales bacterium]|nr:amidohydrolase family protein [Acidimicrobiales bacterium]